MKVCPCFGCSGGGYKLEKFTCGEDVPKASKDVAAVERYKDGAINYVSKWGIRPAKVLVAVKRFAAASGLKTLFFFFSVGVWLPAT